jgi:hypothetical protein
LVIGIDFNSAPNNGTEQPGYLPETKGVSTQQGGKLVGSGASGSAGSWQAYSVSISADGNTVMLGGPNDNVSNNTAPDSAVWVFTRSNGTWTQQGQGGKITGAGGNFDPNLVNNGLGSSVSLNADGNTAIIGATGDKVELVRLGSLCVIMGYLHVILPIKNSSF